MVNVGKYTIHGSYGYRFSSLHAFLEGEEDPPEEQVQEEPVKSVVEEEKSLPLPDDMDIPLDSQDLYPFANMVEKGKFPPEKPLEEDE